MAEEVILDVETKKAFCQVGGYKPKKLGVSFVGALRREVGKGEGEFLSFFEEDLGRLWPVLERADRVVGFNIIGFDLPVLSEYYGRDFENFPVLDILEEVKQATGHRVSLEMIAKATLKRQKSGDGLAALAYYEQGRLKELEKYCLDDVRITRDVYDFGVENEFLKFINKWNREIRVPVDFGYKKAGKAKVQMSFGL